MNLDRLFVWCVAVITRANRVAGQKDLNPRSGFQYLELDTHAAMSLDLMDDGKMIEHCEARFNPFACSRMGLICCNSIIGESVCRPCQPHPKNLDA